MFNKHKLKALSLVEVLVYLAVFGIIFVVIVEFVISVRSSNAMAEERTDLEKTAIYLVNHLNSSFNTTNSISSDTNTVYNVDQGKIHLITNDAYYEYYLDNNVLYFNNNGVVNNITNPDFKITKFYLEQVQNNDGELKGIRCNIVITSIKHDTVSKTIQTSFILK